jgi:NAD(P)-dependent dehydrogenase (short-subunit alcohol dehydrogenase family)
MDLGLDGKRALVSGGSSGIGRACAVQLAREGVRVCIVGRDAARLEESVRLTREAGCEGFAVAADLSAEAGCRSAFEAAQARMGNVDILVNAAGAAQPAPVLELKGSQIDEALGLKLYSCLRLSQLAVPGMREQKWGRIVNIAGHAGTSPDPVNLPTSFANITMMNLTKGLSDEVARDGILVNVVCPGRTNTPRTWQRYQAQAERLGLTMEQFLEQDARSLPARRIAEPEDIALTVCYLVSEACTYVFSSAIYMDGGARQATP